MVWFAVAVAGAVGTCLRYALLQGAVAAGGVGAAPLGTWLANALGSFGLGVVAMLADGHSIAGVDARLVLGVGLMGGFTTYSTFNLESLALIESGQLGRAAGYMAGTMVVCLVVGAAGLYVGRMLRG